MTKQYVGNISFDEDQSIWRYMDLAKFCSLIMFKKLYFCRIDKLSDPFEGMRSKPTLEWVNKVYESTPLGAVKENIELMYKMARRYYLVNCWHKNSNESDAMWKTYSGNSIAVKSSIRRLFECLSDDPLREFYFGSVEYIDYLKQPSSSQPSVELFLNKQLCFEHEREFRVITYATAHQVDKNGLNKPVDSGLYYSVDVNRLIETVYISPIAEKWIRSLLEKILHDYGYQDIAVLDSSILTHCPY